MLIAHTVPFKMNAKVSAIHTSLPNYEGKATRTKYSCYASFTTPRNDDLLKHWLTNYNGIDFKSERYPYLLLSNENYARALVGNFIEGMANVLEIRFEGFASDDTIPSQAPAVADENHKVWVLEKTSTDIETSKGVAMAILKECRYRRDGRIPVSEAGQIFRNATDKNFLWEDVLSEIVSLRGVYTDKYIRNR